jgi:class 3 adenylate cyclase
MYQGSFLGIDFSKQNKWIYPLYQEGENDFFLVQNARNDLKKQLIYVRFNAEKNDYEALPLPFQKISDFSIETIYSDQEDVLWLGGVDGVVRFDLRKSEPDSVLAHTILRELTLGTDSVIYFDPHFIYSPRRKDQLKINHNFGTLKFSFICPSFKDGENLEYSTYLENYDKTWSDWSVNRSREYNALPHGRYIFHVKARDIYHKESPSAMIGFIVQAPVYKTRLAYIAYFIIIIAFSWMLYKVRSYQFAKEKSKLERIIKERTEELVREIERSEDLLVNMLPKQTASELKVLGKASTRKFELVSVMFLDIQGFTEIAGLIDPDVLVKRLDEFFLKVDKIIGKYHLEKIKTLGDGYMCAGGVPEPNRTNPVEVILAAFEIIEFMNEFEFDKAKTNHLNWGLRIGIHSGPVIAGVIGDKKLSYDIWGVTVNNASRMESNGFIGRINISAATHKLISKYFECEYHGTLALRSGDVTEMFFVKGLREEFRMKNQPNVYNDELSVELAEIRFMDLYDFIMAKLQQDLPKNLYYHNIQHTIDVTNSADTLCRKESVSGYDRILVKSAALLHDIGFITDYDNHEYYSVKMAKEILPRFYYNLSQIEKVCELIMATKFPPNPRNHLEKIICDADLDYLGQEKFIAVSRNLFMELYERKKIKSVDEWLKTQIQFIEKHTYYTQTAIQSRNVNKNQQLENLRKMDFLSSFF